MNTINMQATVVRRFLHTLKTCRTSRYSRQFSSLLGPDSGPTSINPQPSSPDSASSVSTNPSTPDSISSASINPPSTIADDEREEFLRLLRNSSFVNMGDPTNKIVRGKIFHVVSDDMYIDFGCKFYCVCPRPSKDGQLYVRGADVLLKIRELELSSHFLGSQRALTLLEADATIINLISSPAKKT